MLRSICKIVVVWSDGGVCGVGNVGGVGSACVWWINVGVNVGVNVGIEVGVDVESVRRYVHWHVVLLERVIRN